jgi:hypothetical protein
VAAYFRARFDMVGLRWANRIAGIVILLFAAVALYDALGGKFGSLG